MIATINYLQLGSFIIIGIICAILLLFYIRQYSTNKKYHFLGFALFVASGLYLVFAVVTMNKILITVELFGLMLFLLFIWMAYRYSFWFIALGWALHIVWDIGVHPQETAPYIPFWYAWVCVGFDIVISIYMAWLLSRSTEKS